MGQATETKPVTDSISKVDDEIAVGEDLGFQERWWKFERIIWATFLVILILDLLGAFGRGWLANAHAETGDGALKVKYERIERSQSPSPMVIQFGSSAIRNGQVQLFVSDSVVKELGAQRIAPQPARSEVGDGGFTYTFPASGGTAIVEFALTPASPGVFHFKMQVPGSQEIEKRVVVMP